MSDTQNTVVTPPHGLLLAILTLAFGGLFIGTGEFVSMSLLPQLAEGTEVSMPRAGDYIGAYAAGVVIGAPVLAIATARWPRKALLLGILTLALAGYLLSAAANGYWTLMAARFIAGLPHGAWYGVASLVAAAMVPKSKRAQAIGYVMLGLAAANVVGVPLTTSLGQLLGWRAAFALVAAGCLVTGLLVWRFIPSIKAAADASLLQELSGLRRPALWLTLAVASIGFGGMFAVYSYITPTLTKVSGFAESSVPLVLVIWGLGMVSGNLLGGWLSDRKLIPAILGIMVWNVFFLTLFSFAAPYPFAVVATLFFIGNGFALVPALQSQLMNVAGNAQTLAASLNHSAFNLANAMGALLGGAAISAGMGWASTGWVGGALALAGLPLMLLSVYVSKRSDP